MPAHPEDKGTNLLIYGSSGIGRHVAKWRCRRL